VLDGGPAVLMDVAMHQFGDVICYNRIWGL